jgi:hypothetical protein
MEGQPPSRRRMFLCCYRAAASRCLCVLLLLAHAVSAQGVPLPPIHYASALTGIRGMAGLLDGTQESAMFNSPSAICGVSTISTGACSACTLVRGPATLASVHSLARPQPLPNTYPPPPRLSRRERTAQKVLPCAFTQSFLAPLALQQVGQWGNVLTALQARSRKLAARFAARVVRCVYIPCPSPLLCPHPTIPPHLPLPPLTFIAFCSPHRVRSALAPRHRARLRAPLAILAPQPVQLVPFAPLDNIALVACRQFALRALPAFSAPRGQRHAP